VTKEEKLNLGYAKHHRKLEPVMFIYYISEKYNIFRFFLKSYDICYYYA